MIVPMKERSEKTISRVMSRIKGKNTGIELTLRKELYALGVRYRHNTSKVYGHPDISIQKYKIAVFCDSEFWHGYNFEENKKKLHKHLDYWIPKIERNIERDKEVNEKLKKEGYTVIRFWGSEINKDPKKCAEVVVSALREKGWSEAKENPALWKPGVSHKSKGED